ncbi:MAG: DEAD/DEAH box helicase, partial [Luteimonas sp.]|nr:DEAD/DEAH box helicase [Luteimonas sp.]
MAAATTQTARGTRKPRQPAIGTGWRTTDAEEIERRRRRAVSEAPRLQAHGRAYYGVYTVHSASGRSHRVEFRSADQPVNSCDCPDYGVNGLGTCKHVEAVRQHLQDRRVPARRSAVEIFLDRSDQYGQGPLVRVLWTVRQAADESVGRIVHAFFGADDTLIGEPLDAVPALRRALYEARLDQKRVRLSEYIAPWLERLQLQRRRHADRENFLADVAAGKRSFDVVQPPLYDYQREGMLHLAFNGRAILADDMGLGKTVQAVAACELLRRLGRAERVLVVSPVSLKTEWQEQIERFTELPAQVVYGSRKQRLQQYREPLFFNLANYEQILADGDDVQRLLAPDVIILDEAQRIKNWQAKTADAVKRLSSPYVFVLTGTPLENRIDEVYSIAQVVDPHLFGPLFRFNRDFHELDERGRPVGYKNLDAMHRRLRPVLLRRRKADVEGELPARTVNTYFVDMHPEQAERYDGYKADVAQLVYKAQRRPLSPEEFQRMQQLLACMRMLCDTPYILDQDCRISPKLDELGRILDEQLADADNKIVIFSEWTRMLDLVREQAEQSGTGFALHTGQVAQQRRRGELNRFKQDPDCRLLLSSDAGATGLNLQAANIVINLDLPWNPAKLEQRIARAWRKHQKRHVTVINLVCQDSIEHRIMHVLEQKRALAEGVLEGAGESEMKLPSSRNAFIERLQSLMGT